MSNAAGDTLFMGRIALSQPATGHRVGTDAVLLAAAAPTDRIAAALDLGAGVGAVGLAYAQRHTAARVYLAEIDPAAAEMARANIAGNGLGERVFVEEGDALLGHGAPVDLVLTNPPYYEAGTARVASSREVAHVMPAGGLDAWIRAALARLRARGRIVMIHRADALPAILASLDRRFGGVQVIPVLPRADGSATRLLVMAVRGSRAPFTLRPPLVLHEDGGAFTPFAAALHRGESLIGWRP